MGFIIILITLVVVFVVLFLVERFSYHYLDDALWIYSAIATPVALISLCIVLFAPIKDARDVSIYKSQYEYLQGEASDNSLEDAALTQKKIELNEWLYEAQYIKENYPLWTFYSDEVLELKPIVRK